MNSTWSLSLSLSFSCLWSAALKKVASRFSSSFPFVCHFDTCWKSNIVVRDQRNEAEKKARATIRSSFYCNISHTITEMISRARYRFHLRHVCLSMCLAKMIGWSARGVDAFPIWLSRALSFNTPYINAVPIRLTFPAHFFPLSLNLSVVSFENTWNILTSSGAFFSCVYILMRIDDGNLFSHLLSLLIHLKHIFNVNTF